MAKVTEAQLIEQFNKAKKALDGFRKEERARQRREKAEADEMRERLAGRMILNHVQANPHHHERFIAQMDAFLEDDKHRALFGLPSKNAATAAAVQNGQQDPPSSLIEPLSQ